MKENPLFLLGLLFLASLPLAGCSPPPIGAPRKIQSPADKEAKIDEASIDGINLVSIGDRFRIKPYLQAAALLQNLGKEKACKRLAELAENGGDGKVEILCRMLFSKKPRSSLRPPSLG